MRKLFCYFTAVLFGILAVCSLCGAIVYEAWHQLYLLVPEVLFSVIYWFEAKSKEA